MAIESVGGSLVSKIAELLEGPVKKQFRYMFCFDNFVQEFNDQVMSLALAFYGLQDAVDAAKRNAEEIEIDVNKWLEDAKNKMEGVNRLENEKGKNGKCFTLCPKWIHQFKLSKALEKKTETLRKLEEKSKKFLKEFTTSESSKVAFEQIMKALKDDNVNMIGLYGMGGVGKTTLVKEVGRRAKETQQFDEVLLATVSQNPNVIDIQDRMAESLGLHFDEKTTEGRANRLWQRLKIVKKLLVILDDVWKVVNLKETGIPVGDAHRGCKVLLTTPSSKEHGFMVKAGTGLKEWPMSNKSFEGCTTISLMGNKLAELPQGLVCPQLKVLLLELDYDVNVPERFFEGMKEIEVLSLEGGCLSLQSLEFSTNLQSLLLMSCKCNDLISLRKLQRLKILGFIWCFSLEELPDEIGELKELRLLDVTGCFRLGRIPVNLIGRLKKLEELLIGGSSFTGWDAVGSKWRQALNNLTSVEIENCESLEEVFELGEAEEGINEEKELRLLSSLTRLKLTWLRELKCIWKGPTRYVSLQSLVHLELQALHKLTFIFTPHLAQSLVHLETLLINSCSGLKHLIREKDDEREIIPESLGFPKLKTLSISDCYQLEYVFPVSVSPSLLNLEKITISYGCNLKQIFYSGEGDAHTSDGVINFPQLRKLSLSSGCSFFGPKNFTAQLPSLQVLYIEGHEELGDLLAQLQVSPLYFSTD
ncbi:disease resistance protein [Salix suchowensis]|nr:disease resistance protein [Salix suchowensis]